MPRKKLPGEQLIMKLRQIEVMRGQGRSIAPACKEAEFTEQSFETNA